MMLIRRAVRKGEISTEEFDARVKKILAAKYWAGLNNYQPTPIAHLYEDLNRPAEQELVQQLSDAAVTLLKGNAASLQLNPFIKTAIVSIGVTQYTTFQKDLSRWYPNCAFFMVGKNASVNDLNSLYVALKQYGQIFVSINDTRPRPLSKLDYGNDVKLFIAQLAARNNTVISVFANPYTIAGLPGIEKVGALLACYQMTDDLQRAAVRVIIRRMNPTGKLPVNVNMFFPYGTGISL